MSSRRAKTLSPAFTLVELLVVVAIIALLIAILLPALNRAREQGKQTLCLTNLKSIGQGMLFYAGDNRESVIRAESPFAHYSVMLLPYVGQPDDVRRLFLPTGDVDRTKLLDICRATPILNCPTFPMPEQPLDYVVSALEVPFRFRASDTIADYTGDGPRADYDDRRALFTNISRLGRKGPAEFVFMIEAHANMPLPGNRSWSLLTDLFKPDHLPLGAFPRVANDDRHPRGITAAFFDGRADVLPVRKYDPGPGNSLRDRMRRFTYDENEPY